jgi:hypothetical protein
MFYLTFDPSGQLWYSYKDRRAQMAPPGKWPSWLFEAEAVGIPALAHNCPLILGCYKKFRCTGRPNVWVCSPLCCPDPQDRNDSRLLLFAASQFQVPASLGGWHLFTEQDHISYILNQADHGSLTKLLQQHPAWPALSFIWRLDQVFCARLLGTLLDPRWYVHRRRPNRQTYFESFLGLCPSIQKKIYVKHSSENIYLKRCLLVNGCWQKVLEDPGAWDQPGAFLLRCYQRCPARWPWWRRSLHTSCMFLRYLRWAWLDALGGSPEPLLDPETFLPATEAACLLRHLQQYRATGYS